MVGQHIVILVADGEQDLFSPTHDRAQLPAETPTDHPDQGPSLPEHPRNPVGPVPHQLPDPIGGARGAEVLLSDSEALEILHREVDPVSLHIVLTKVLKVVEELQAGADEIRGPVHHRVLVTADPQHQSPDRIGGMPAIPEQLLLVVARHAQVRLEGLQELEEQRDRKVHIANALAQVHEQRQVEPFICQMIEKIPPELHQGSQIPVLVHQVVGSAGKGVDPVQVAPCPTGQQPGAHREVLVVGRRQGHVPPAILGHLRGGMNFRCYLHGLLHTGGWLFLSRKDHTMDIDFDSVENVADYVTVPPGTYLCRVGEVRPGTTRGGDERWAIRLVVVEGEFTGRQAAWDSLVFSTRGRARARKIFAALGLPSKGKVTVQPADLEGKQAFVEVRPVEFTHPGGEVVRRNEVPYDGFRPVEEETREKPSPDDPNIPF